MNNDILAFLAERKSARAENRKIPKPPKLVFSDHRFSDVPIPDDRDYLIADEKRNGLFLRVQVSGTKTFVINKRVTNINKTVQVKIGRFGNLDIPTVRKEASRIIQEMELGRNPNAEKKQALLDKEVEETLETAHGKTLREVFDLYQEQRTAIQNTKDGDNRRIINHLGKDAPTNYEDRPITDLLDTNLLFALRDQITDKSGYSAALNTMMLLRVLADDNQSIQREAGIEVKGWPLVRRTTRDKSFWKPLRSKPRNNFIAKDDLKSWWSASKQEDAGDLMRFLLMTGMRRREASINLVWENVDLGRKEFVIEDTKNNEPLSLPLTPYTLAMLERMHEEQGRPMSGQVFIADGPEIRVDAAIKNIQKTTGIRATPHDLRRTFATMAETFVLLPHRVVNTLQNHGVQTISPDVGANYVIVDETILRTHLLKYETWLLKTVGELDADIIEFTATRQ